MPKIKRDYNLLQYICAIRKIRNLHELERGLVVARVVVIRLEEVHWKEVSGIVRLRLLLLRL